MTSSVSTPLEKAGERFYGLDAVRASALLLGIVFHGIQSFPFYMKEHWLVHDVQRSVVLDALYCILHFFRMQAFFLIAGFFAHLLYLTIGGASGHSFRIGPCVFSSRFCCSCPLNEALFS